MYRAAWTLAAAGGIGLAPLAPATVASAAALAAYALLPIGSLSPALWALVAAGFPAGVWAAGRCATTADPDPRFVVWDEVVGMWAACLAVPKSWPFLLAAFLLFRALDVLKPFPIGRLERLPGGLGIMADDLAAGAVTALLLGAARVVLT